MAADSTQPGDNRFEVKIYLRRTEDGVLVPLLARYRRRATFVVRLQLEYPTYQEERNVKLNCTRWRDKEKVFFVDYDALDEIRVSRCLIGWNLHELFPGRVEPIQRAGGQPSTMLEASLQQWRNLPPLLRKSITGRINEVLGGY